MGDKTKIEWATATWNPITGCSPISDGCDNCYAKRMANRLKGRYGYPKKDPFKITFHENKLDQPIRWKKPRRIFVCSMSDIFHGNVTDEMRQSVLDVISKCEQHTFMILTKRSLALNAYFKNKAIPPNLWLGVTVEKKNYLSKAIELSKVRYAPVRFISIEPCLGPINLYGMDGYIDWVILGGESGPNARPMKKEWARQIRDYCIDLGIPFFFKQWGKYEKGRTLDGKIWNQFPKLPFGGQKWNTGKKIQLLQF